MRFLLHSLYNKRSVITEANALKRVEHRCPLFAMFVDLTKTFVTEAMPSSQMRTNPTHAIRPTTALDYSGERISVVAELVGLIMIAWIRPPKRTLIPQSETLRR